MMGMYEMPLLCVLTKTYFLKSMRDCRDGSVVVCLLFTKPPKFRSQHTCNNQSMVSHMPLTPVLLKGEVRKNAEACQQKHRFQIQGKTLPQRNITENILVSAPTPHTCSHIQVCNTPYVHISHTVKNNKMNSLKIIVNFNM